MMNLIIDHFGSKTYSKKSTDTGGEWSTGVKWDTGALYLYSSLLSREQDMCAYYTVDFERNDSYN